MSAIPSEPRPGTITARVLAALRRGGPVALPAVAAEAAIDVERAHHVLMRLRSELRHNIVAVGDRRFELRPGVFPNAPPAPRPGTLQARVLARLRVCPVDLARDSARLFDATPTRVRKAIAALRWRRDLNIRVAGPGAYELLPGRYSERGYHGQQCAPLTLELLHLLRVRPEVDLAYLAKCSGRSLRKLRSTMQSIRYRYPVANLGRDRFALRCEDPTTAAEVAA